MLYYLYFKIMVKKHSYILSQVEKCILPTTILILFGSYVKLIN